MRKFLAVVKREYLKIVWSLTFIISTLLAPILMALIGVLPMALMTMKGEPVRLAVVDHHGDIAGRLRENLSPQKQMEKFRQAVQDTALDVTASQEDKMKLSAQQAGSNFAAENFAHEGKTDDEIRSELAARIQSGTLDAYLIIPADMEGKVVSVEFFTRNPSDIVTRELLSKALDDAVRSSRLAKANISENQLRDLSRGVKLETTKVSEKGLEKDTGFGAVVGFVIGMFLYITLTLYGTAILGAIIEEKETRIAEILFSSARPFELMMGKLVGVGLAGLTQVGIWVGSATALLGSGVILSMAGGVDIPLPTISGGMIFYFLIFFLLGFFIYATLYALIGSIVTTSQEGQQFALPPVMILLVGFLSMFAVIRDPNSTFSFWMSIAPFLSPIIMPVRIVIETPPFWQIALAIVLNILTIVVLVWAAAKVYRIGMLMYGKRATIPEVWRWIRQP